MRSLWFGFLLLLAMLGSALTVERGLASTTSIDAVRGQATREQKTVDHTPIDWSVGAVIPDFAFTDFNGQPRHLSEFRGKYLLLEFWGVWCKPCVAEIPNLKAAYEKYKSRGFEVLGMDYEPLEKGKDPITATKETLEMVKKFASEKGMTWTQATPESVKDIIEKRFQIRGFPRTILLDPQGKVITRGVVYPEEPPPLQLRGEELMKTLEQILPAK